MTEELKNKDGVPIRPKQIWRAEGYYDGEVVGVRGDEVVVWFEGSKDCECYHRQSRLFYQLISDPIWGYMLTWRIVTDEEREKYKIPSCAEFWNGKSQWCQTNKEGYSNWRNGEVDEYTIYRVPRTFRFEAQWQCLCADCRYGEQEPKREPIEPITIGELSSWSNSSSIHSLWEKQCELIDRVNELEARND